ncbi:MAG: sensor domain-containing diguanylate cyclase [Pseudomonadota bacterium]
MNDTRAPAMTPILPPADQLLDLLPDAVCVVDESGKFLYVSRAFERILGYARGEVAGYRAFDLVHPDDREATLAQAARVMAGALQRHFRNRYRHKDGHWVDIQWSARFDPEFGVRIAIGREVTELREAERELEHLASHDPLTGLLNRHRLQRELTVMVENAEAAGEAFALLYLDLDGFKAVNDRGGHEIGDRLLREVGQRLRQGVRQSDVVGRMGGDEFVILLPRCRDEDAARKVGESLRAKLRPRFSMPDGAIELDASVGVACFPRHGRDPDALLAYADRAMYAIKRTRAASGEAGRYPPAAANA